MKKIYEKPVMVIESLVNEEIMKDDFKYDNVLSYNPENGYGGYTDPNTGKFIQFGSGSGNLLNSIDYDAFIK